MNGYLNRSVDSRKSKMKESINELYDRLGLHKWWQEPLPPDSEYAEEQNDNHTLP